MTSRRDFVIKSAAAAGLAAASPFDLVNGQTIAAASVTPCTGRQCRIKRLSRRENTICRLGGSGDNFHTTWATDGNQYTALCDGYGWSERPTGVYTSRLFRVIGRPENASIEDVSDYPLHSAPNGATRYYGFGTLAADGRIYQFLSTFNHTNVEKHKESGALSFIGAKLIYSPDGGRTWCNQDGSTPVTWESAEQRSRATMVFYDEPDLAFSILSLAQMGKDYGANSDGYIYAYSPNGIDEGTMNELVMFRAPKSGLLDRGNYEYFAGLSAKGEATWSRDIERRVPTCTFPGGWVNRTSHPWAWVPSVTYNPGLGQFMMASWATGASPEGEWFAKPSYLGFWTAPNPWGPWAQVHEETAWMPGGDPKARAFAPQIPAKWIAEDGRSFWIIWSDYQGFKGLKLPPDLEQRYSSGNMAADDWARSAKIARRQMPYYSFNVQRVDLEVA